MQLHEDNFPLICHTAVSPVSGCGVTAEEHHFSNTQFSSYCHREKTSARLGSSHMDFPGAMSLHLQREKGTFSQSFPKTHGSKNTVNGTCAPESDGDILTSLLLPRGQAKSLLQSQAWSKTLNLRNTLGFYFKQILCSRIL